MANSPLSLTSHRLVAWFALLTWEARGSSGWMLPGCRSVFCALNKRGKLLRAWSDLYDHWVALLALKFCIIISYPVNFLLPVCPLWFWALSMARLKCVIYFQYVFLTVFKFLASTCRALTTTLRSLLSGKECQFQFIFNFYLQCMIKKVYLSLKCS